MRRLSIPRVAFYASIGLTVALCLLVSPRFTPAASFAWPQRWAPNEASAGLASADTPELAGNVGLESSNSIIVLVSGTNVTATTGSNVAIGEVITYSVVITVNDNSTYGNVVLTSTLSDGLAFVSCAQITAHASITTSIAGSFPAVCASPTVINDGRNISFTFGTVRNANTYAGSAEAVTVQFTAVVLNTSASNAGDILTAKARWKWSTPSTGNVTSLENVVIYEPSLTLSKSGGTGTPRTGQNVAFTLDLTNDSTVTYPAVAYDVVVTDTIPSGMTYANNITTLQGKAPDGFVADTGSGVITATWNYVAPGDLIRLRYYATVNGDVAARTVITNTAGLVASSIPGAPVQPISSYNASSTERTGYDVGSQADGYRHNDYAIVTVTTPDLVITKSDGVTSAAPGDTLTYTIRVTNTGNYHADNVVVTETVPANAVFLASPRSSSGWSCANNAPAGTTCLFAFSGADNPLNAGASVSALRFVVKVTDTVSVGSLSLTNTVKVGDDGNHGIDPTLDNNGFSDIDALSGQIDLTLTKVDSGVATAGNPITYTIFYTNLGTTTATNVVLTETVPVSTSYGSGAPWTCTPSGAAGSVCTRSLPDLGGGASGSATFTVTVANPPGIDVSSIANTAAIGVPGGADADMSNNAATISTTVKTEIDLAVTKIDNGMATPGNPVIYTIFFTNTGNQNATGVVLTETVPQNTAYSGSGWTCSPSSAAGSVCTRSVGNLAGGGAGGSVTFAVTVANPLATGVDSVANTVNIGDDGANGDDVDTSNNSSTITTTVNAAPDLVVTKKDNGAATPGNQIVYTIAYTNTGNQNATGVVLSETVPQNTTYSGSGWTCAPSSVAGSVCTRSVGNLAGGGAGGSVTFAVTVANPLATGVDSVANTVNIGDDSANGADADMSNNSSTITTTVNAAPDLVVTKKDNGAATPGNQIVYTIAYTNTGNQNATGVVLSEIVPQNTTYSGSGWTCAPSSAAGSVCTRSIGHLAGGGAGGSVTFAVTVANPLAAGVDSVANTVNIGDDGANGADADMSNNSSTITTTVNAAPDLVVTKKDNGAATAGGQIVYTIAYTNTGNQNATGVVLTETVPQNTTYSGSGWTCSPSSAAGSVCTHAIGDLGGGGASGSAVFAVTVDTTLPAGIDSVANTVSIGDDNANGADVDTSNNTATITTPVTAAADLVISKSDGGVGTTPGGDIQYTLSYTNSGNQGASGIVVTETVPAGTLFKAGASNAAWTCMPDGGAGQTCLLTIAGLAAGSSGTISFTVAVTDPLSAGQSVVTNTVRIGDDDANGADPTPDDRVASDTTPVTSAPELQISKRVDTQNALPASVVKFTLNYTNAGNVGACGVTISETVPALSTFSASDSAVGWTCSSINPGGVCTLDAGMVDGRGGHGAAVFAVKLLNPIEAQAGPITITNSATIGDDGSNGADPNTLNNTATTVIGVTPTNFAKFAWASTAGQGYAARFTIVLRNSGVEAMHNVVITDLLPLNVRFSDATIAVVSSAMPSVFSGWAASGGVYDGNRTVVWNVGEVPAGQYVAIKVLVYVYSGTPVGTVLTNSAILSAGGQEAITATAQVVVVASGQIRPPEPTTTPAPTPPSALCPAGDGARVDVGSAISYTDSFGHIWAADRAYAPGQNTWGYTAEGFVYATQHAIAATDDPQLYQTERWWPASGGYRFDAPNGNYLVTLKLAEIYPWATIGSRVFTVSIENTAVVSHLDVVRIAGQYTAYDATFSVTVQDGVLNVDIRSEQGSPSLKGIMFERVVTCGTGGAATPTPTPQPPASAGPTPTATPGNVDAPRCAPLRIDAGATAAHSDSAGNVWLADQRYVQGATTWGYKGLSAVYNSSAAIAATSDPLLYRSERWWEQNGGYEIEVANGSYQVTLKFAEIYPWVSAGSRAFDIKIEDALVLSHLDVFGRAGGNAAYDLTFTAVVNDGVLNIDVVRQHGNPALNGMVVTRLTGCAGGG